MGANTQVTEEAMTPSPPITDRRTLFTRAIGASALVAGALAAGCGSSNDDGGIILPRPSPGPSNGPGVPTEADILNFALNLEYLEAEYYLRGLTGSGLNAGESGGNAGAVAGGRQVSFPTPTIRALVEEIANDERAHVNFLRARLGGSAVVRPAIDFTTAFNAAANAAGIGPTFDPFANELNFLLGAFLFEDVGVTAYRGGARFLTTPAVIEAAAGILAVEAAHAGAVRSLVYDAGPQAQQLADRMSALRAQAGGGKDEGLTAGTLTGSGGANFVPTDAQARVYGRTPAEVLRIVYLNGASAGGFFPGGVNGALRAA